MAPLTRWGGWVSGGAQISQIQARHPAAQPPSCAPMAQKPRGTIGILTAGGDCPGLNAVIRGVAKAAMHHGIRVVGIRDGFRGLVENRTMELSNGLVSGILMQGGTFLGSSRDKPHKMPVGQRIVDMTEVAVKNYRRLK